MTATMRVPIYVPKDDTRVLLRVVLTKSTGLPMDRQNHYRIRVGVQNEGRFSSLGEYAGNQHRLTDGGRFTLFSGNRTLGETDIVAIEADTNGTPPSLLNDAMVQVTTGYRTTLLGLDIDRSFSAVLQGSGALEQVTTYPLAGVFAPTSYPILLDSDNSAVSVSSSTSETTLYSVMVPGGILQGDRSVRVLVVGSYVNNDGAARDLTFKVKYGSTAMWGDLQSITNNASVYRWEMSFSLLPSGGLNSAQRVSGYLGFFGPGGASVAGTGDFGTASCRGFGSATSSEDATAALELSVTATHGTSSVNIVVEKYNGRAEIL